MTPVARKALQAVADTLVPDGSRVQLAERLAEAIGRLPRAADRAELEQLLGMLESRALNLALVGIPRPFSAMGPAQRERYLAGWATSRLGLRRKAFQALKRLATVLYYTATDAEGRNAAWAGIGYPGPLGAPPPTPRRIRPLAITRDTTLDCDVVVVGSGAGGGVVAGELAASGKDVIVLDKGGYSAESDFSHLEGDALRRLYDAGGLRATDDLGLVILQGSCLGGGTVINYTTSFRTPDGIREQWAERHRLPHFTALEFSASLDAVARRVNANTDEAQPSGRDRVLIRGLDGLGWDHGYLPRNTRGCPQDDECGYCGLGCRRGAKQSTLVTYLQDAADRGARFVVECDVRRVTLEQRYAVGVEGIVRGADGGRHALRVRARATVVAAGAIHSPALLLRSGVELPALGRHLALHPATAVFGLMDEAVRPWTGTLQAHYSDEFADLDDGYGFKLETAPMHPSLAALGFPWTTARQHGELMARLPHVALVGILLRDRGGDGRVGVDRDGEPVVSYRVSAYDGAHLRQGIAAGAELLEAAGAREIWTPQSRWVAFRPDEGAGARARWAGRVDAAGYGPNELLLVTFHQMASCRMGADPRTAVVNPVNQVFGVGGLYVADASTFPSASGVNPMLTIMGIAHRAARIIATEMP